MNPSLVASLGRLAFRRRSWHNPPTYDPSLAACEGKQAFPTRQDAGLAERARERRGGPVLDVYRCSHCGGWHLGKRPK